MKYYSEKLSKLFDTEAECQAAEHEAKKKENEEKIKRERAEREAKEKKEKLIAERKARANEVEEARKAMISARSNHQKLLQNFIKDYGAYHYSVEGKDLNDVFSSFSDFVDYIFK